MCRDRNIHIGTATCKTCSATYETTINCKILSILFLIFNELLLLSVATVDLSEPIDIYSEWIDAINERENSKKKRKSTAVVSEK